MPEGKPTGFLARYGGRLIDAGYKIVPIRRGSKAPPGDDWQKTRANKKLLRSWVEGAHSRAGVGILTRETPLVDLDIPDERVALRMEDWIQERFGFGPVRVGKAPKRGLLFRAEEPFRKVQSAFWEDPMGDDWEEGPQGLRPVGRKVEILGDGQQFVAYHIHPDTGKPYEWLYGTSPIKTRATELPVLSEADAREIVAEFERLAKDELGWEMRKSSQALARRQQAARRNIDYDDAFAADTAKVEDLTEEEIETKLMLVPGNEDYDTWLQVGMALFHQYDGEPKGLELWHSWSMDASNYEAQALDDKWDTFDISQKGRAPVTARLIIKLAAEREQEIATEVYRDVVERVKVVDDITVLKDICAEIKKIEFDSFQRTQLVGLVQGAFKRITTQTLPIKQAREMTRYERPALTETPRWLEPWVYLEMDDAFYSLKDRRTLKREVFNATMSKHLLTAVDRLEGKAAPEQLPAHVALNLYDIPRVWTRMYLPGEDEMFTIAGRKFVNSYDAGEVPDVPDKLTRAEREAVAMVEAHFEHLFFDERDRRLLIDFCAYIVQSGKRVNWSVLMQGVEGDGKSFIAVMLAAALGASNVRSLHATSLEEKYTSWAEGSQINFFEEIKLHGHNRFDVLNKVKPLITNRMVSIRRMQTDTYEAVNTASYIFTTNFRDALPLDDKDRRYFVLFSRFQSKDKLLAFLATDPDYYTRLYDAADSHPGAIRRWLLKWKISSEFAPNGRAPESRARREMIEYETSREAEILQDLLASGENPDITATVLDATVLPDALVAEGGDALYGRALNKLLLDHGFTKIGRFRSDSGSGEKHLYWSREPDLFLTGGQFDVGKLRDWLDPGL